MTDSPKYAIWYFGLSLLLCLPVFSQEKAKVSNSQVTQVPTYSDSADRRAPSLREPPFDRLELLAFVAGQFSEAYASHVIHERGVDFTPDEAFLSAVRELRIKPQLLDRLTSLKPRVAHSPSSQHDAAYAILLRVTHALHQLHFVSAGEGYKEALQLAPDSATLHLAYAVDLLLLRHYEEAEAESRRSLQLWPDDAEAHGMLATALSGQDRDSEAIPEAREALRIFPEHKAALIELGFCLTRSSRYEEAIPVLREAIPRTPEMPLLYKHLGVSLFHTGDIDGAIKELTLFLKASPDDAEGHYQLGVALRAKGHQADAQAQFREAARIEPSNPLYATVAESDAAHKPPNTSNGPRPDDSSISGNVYTNNFFGFSFEFPKGWTVMSADEARSLMKLGGTLLASGDPVLQDATKASVRNSYPLLFLIEGRTKNDAISTRMIQIHAADKSGSPELKSGEDFLRLSAKMYKELGMPIEIAGAFEKLVVGGKEFWRADLNMRMNNRLQHGSQIVTLDKDYVLLFVFLSPDPAGLKEIENTIQSVRFIHDDDSAPLALPSGGSDKQQSGSPGYTASTVEILTPTDGVDFKEYLTRLVAAVIKNWLAVMPQSARLGEKGRVVVQFHVLPDGSIPNADPAVFTSSEKDELDRSAVAAIRGSAPFERLPAEFKRPFLELRMIFLYNLPMKN